MTPGLSLIESLPMDAVVELFDFTVPVLAVYLVEPFPNGVVSLQLAPVVLVLTLLALGGINALFYVLKLSL
jgi:hypothetical protein